MTDESLFSAAMSDVKPLSNSKSDTIHFAKNNQNNTNYSARRKAAEAKESIDLNHLTTEKVELVLPDDILSYKKDGVQQGVFKNLRLGKYELHSQLNLHGKSVNEARVALYNFIEDCHRLNLRSLLVQHGKGVKSQPNQAVIKSYVNQWLKGFNYVLAFHSAQSHHGGSGALYVLLKKSDDAKLHNREKHQKRSN